MGYTGCERAGVYITRGEKCFGTMCIRFLRGRSEWRWTLLMHHTKKSGTGGDGKK